MLEGLEAVRKRPAMYIGSTDTRGLMHCLWEIIDNAVDEALAGYGDRIEVRLDHDGSILVTDRARGIPVDIEPRTGLTGVEVVYTKLHAGGKFGAGSYNATGGLHGVGASVVNALSARLDVEVDRNGATHSMSFRRGVPGRFAGPGPDAPFTPDNTLVKSGRVGKNVTRHQGPLLARSPDLPQGRPAVPHPAPGQSPADQLPGPRPGVAGHRRARRDRGGGGLQARRRNRRVLRLPVHRYGGHRGAPAAG